MNNFKQYYNSIIVGSEFNKLLTDDIILCKIMCHTMKHYGFQYKYGLNIDTNIFRPTIKIKKGGLYFATYEHIHQYANNGNIVKVKIPDDAQVYIMETEFKADKIIIIFDETLHLKFCKYNLENNMCNITDKNTRKMIYLTCVQNDINLINYIPEDDRTKELYRLFFGKNIILNNFVSNKNT